MIILVLGIVLTGVYFYDSVSQQLQYNKYADNVTAPAVSGQFYNNMRYPDRTITYTIAPECNFKKQEDIAGAFAALESKTVLKFIQSNGGEINFLCSNVAASPDEAGHFIAGEGGPSKIVDAGRFSVILSGKISLYRPEKCQTPQVAIHEILHSLGFDHNGNKKSILYPITECDQEIDQYLIDNINTLYAFDSKSDLVVTSAQASKSGAYLDFVANVSNQGLKDSPGADLLVFANGKQIDKFAIGKMGIGIVSTLKVSNIALGGNPDKIEFVVESSEEELSKDNNRVEISLA